MGKEQEVKPRQHITPVGAQTTCVDVWKWGQELERLHTRLAPRFARPQPRRRTLAYLKGIVGSVERKNGWKPGRTRRRKSCRWDATVTGQRGLEADLVRDESLAPTSWNAWAICTPSW